MSLPETSASLGHGKPADGSDRGLADAQGGEGAPAASATAGLSHGPAATYDLLIPGLIPGYSSLARLAVTLLAASPLAAPAGASVLIAGCGTGAELLEARSVRPDWRLTGLDPSAAMLNLAQDRLGPSTAIEWRCCTVEALEGGCSFDGALAVLVLQSLPDDGQKLGFLTALANQLRPGAQLVLVDLMQPERSPLEEQISRAWTLFQEASGLEPSSIDAATVFGSDYDPIGTARLTALLNAAGYGDPALIFQALNFAGYLVQKRS